MFELAFGVSLGFRLGLNYGWGKVRISFRLDFGLNLRVRFNVWLRFRIRVMVRNRYYSIGVRNMDSVTVRIRLRVLVRFTVKFRFRVRLGLRLLDLGIVLGIWLVFGL